MNIVIATYCNELYVPHMATMIRSAQENSPKDVGFQLFILYSDVSIKTMKKATRSWNNRRVFPTWCHVDLALHRFAAYAHVSADSMSRLLVASNIAPGHSRVILLDSDLIVLKDLTSLWTLDLEGNVAMAAVNQDSPVVSMVHCPLLGLFGYDPTAQYFNAGVMVIDLDRWKQEGIEAQLLQLVSEKIAFTRWGDQCILNAVLKGRWGSLDPSWNVQVGDDPYSCQVGSGVPLTEEILAARINPAIIHYTGEVKPWHSNCHLMHSAAYHKYKRQTEFAS